MKLIEFSDRFFVKFFSIRCFMKIEISSENFISTFTRENHFYTHRFYKPGKQVHGRTGAHCSYIIRFDMINHIPNGVQAFLNGIIDFMMNGINVFGHVAGCSQIGRTFQSDGK